MADFTTLADAMFTTGKPVLGSTQIAQRDNYIAIAEGAAGAPRIVRPALSTATSSAAGTIAPTASVGVNLDQYSFFPDMRLGIQLELRGTGSANAGTPGLTLFNTNGTESTDYSIAWRYITT